ncbi:unnamed protein product, partial [Mesorhabditis belari]|uniref:Uncharacterized protein n=1 Tax=Mesorhabditis belari TaxID=2138241 RepID=A0AAF3EX46_9BILA
MSANTTISGDFDPDQTMEENEAIEYISTALAKIVNTTPDNEFRLSALQAAEATNLSEFTSNIQERVRERYKEMHELSRKSQQSQSTSQTQNSASQSQSFASVSQSQCSTWMSQAESETSNYFSSQPIFDDDELTRMKPDDEPGTSNLPAFWYKEMHELSNKSQQSQTQNSASQSTSQTQNLVSQSMSQTQNSASQSMGQTQSLASQLMNQTQNLDFQLMGQTQSLASQSMSQIQNSASQSMSQTQSLASQLMNQTQNLDFQSMGQTQNSASRSMSQMQNSASQSMNQTQNLDFQSMSQTQNSASQSMSQMQNSASQSMSQTQNSASQLMNQTQNLEFQSMSQTENSPSQSISPTRSLTSQSQSFDSSRKSIVDLWKDRNKDMIEFWRDMSRGKVTKTRLIQQITTAFGHLREYCLLKAKSWSWFLDVQLYVIRCVRLYEYTFRQGITEVSTLMPFFLEQTLKKFLAHPARISVTSTIWHQIREVLTVIFNTTTNSDLLILMLEALENMQTDFIRKHVIPLVGRQETTEKHAERLIVAHVMKEFSRFREEILNRITCISPIAGLF